MPDISLSPIPYNNGTLLTGQYQNSHCMLQPGVFLHVIAQTNPSYVYAYVTTLTNYKTGTYSTVASPMRAVLSPGSTPAAPTTLNAIRLIKLNSTAAAMIMNGTMYVLSVGANNDVTLVTTASTGLSHNSATPNYQGDNQPMYYSNSQFCGGSAWMYHYVRDNCVFGYTRGSATSQEYNSAVAQKITYNPSTGTLSVAIAGNPSQINTWTSGTQGICRASVARSHMMDIPGSTTKLYQYRVNPQNSTGTSQNLQKAAVASAYLIDSSNNVSALPMPALNVNGLQSVIMMIPLATNRILGFIDNKSYIVYNGTSWSTTPIVFATNSNFGSSPAYCLFEGYALDANYFVIYTAAMSGNGDLGNGSNPSIYMRIGRYVDAGLGQVSSNTASGDGMLVNMNGSMIHDQQPVFRDGTDTAFWLNRDTTTPQRPAYKFQYQAGG